MTKHSYYQSPEYRQKMSEALKKHYREYPRTEETSRKLSKSLKRYNQMHPVHYLAGRKFSEDHKQKISETLKGIKRPYAKERMQGSNNPMWKGDTASERAARARAKTVCSVPENFERHHIDGNPFNNTPANIEIVTRREHMIKDGRMFGRDDCGRFKCGRVEVNK